jgi:selenocysteine lyase/cysteine desulfurase
VPSHPDHHGAHLVGGDRYEWAAGARRFEHWEHNVAGWLGLGAAVDHARSWGIERIEATVVRRAAELRTMLVEAGLTVWDEGVEQCGIVTTTRPDVPAEELQARLAQRRINCTTTPAGSSRWDVERRRLPTLLRLSVHAITTREEIDLAVDVLGR